MADIKIIHTFALAIKKQAFGTLADRLGNGLQNRVEQFDSARYLSYKSGKVKYLAAFLFLYTNCIKIKICIAFLL